MVLAPNKGYLVDSDALIHLLGGKNPQAPMRFLTRLAKSGRFRVPDAVLREVDRQERQATLLGPEKPGRAWGARDDRHTRVP